MSLSFGLRGFARPLQQTTKTTTLPRSQLPTPWPIRAFHATPPAQKKQASGGEASLKLKHFKAAIYSPPPAPLRMARNRALRHWTIHRAWLLFQRKQREAKERELYRMHQSMYNACEELRRTSGPGSREEGYLYRVAMEKKGIYAAGSVPIEYAKAQTDTPAREAWNHDWKP